MAKIFGALALSLIFNVLVLLFAPMDTLLARPGRALYEALPEEAAGFVFGYEGQRPHHYLWAICTVALWWIAFAVLWLALARWRGARKP